MWIRYSNRDTDEGLINSDHIVRMWIADHSGAEIDPGFTIVAKTDDSNFPLTITLPTTKYKCVEIAKHLVTALRNDGARGFCNLTWFQYALPNTQGGDDEEETGEG